MLQPFEPASCLKNFQTSSKKERCFRRGRRHFRFRRGVALLVASRALCRRGMVRFRNTQRPAPPYKLYYFDDSSASLQTLRSLTLHDVQDQEPHCRFPRCAMRTIHNSRSGWDRGEAPLAFFGAITSVTCCYTPVYLPCHYELQVSAFLPR